MSRGRESAYRLPFRMECGERRERAIRPPNTRQEQSPYGWEEFQRGHESQISAGGWSRDNNFTNRNTPLGIHRMTYSIS